MNRQRTNKEELKKIASRIRKIRLRFRKTQDEMVKTLKISRSNYSRIESGRSMPNLELLQFLNKEYKISLEWILTGKGSMTSRKILNESISIIADSPSLLALIEDVARIPLVKFKILELYYRYKEEQRQLLEERR